MKNRKRKTEAERIEEYLLSEGFHEVTEEEKKEEWYKVASAPISCETESEEEFERLCNIKPDNDEEDQAAQKLYKSLLKTGSKKGRHKI